MIGLMWRMNEYNDSNQIHAEMKSALEYFEKKHGHLPAEIQLHPSHDYDGTIDGIPIVPDENQRIGDVWMVIDG